MEMLVRLVKCKFLETGIYDNYADALGHFFTQVLPRYQPYMKPWHDFRVSELWGLDVNDTLHANLEPLRKLYKALIIPGKAPRTVPNYRDAIKFLTGKHPSLSPAAHAAGNPNKPWLKDQGEDKPSARHRVEDELDDGRSVALGGADDPELKLRTHLTENSFQLSEKQARYCYAMSKMTILHESTDGIKYYDQLVFVEFLELLGRIASV